VALRAPRGQSGTRETSIEGTVQQLEHLTHIPFDPLIPLETAANLDQMPPEMLFQIILNLEGLSTKALNNMSKTSACPDTLVKPVVRGIL